MNTQICIQKQRHHFANIGPSCQSYDFSSSYVWKWELDHKEVWAQKNWCFWTLVVEKTLKVTWTARRSNHSILKEINSEYSMEELMLKLKLQYFGHLMWRADPLEKTLMLGKVEGGRRQRWQMTTYLDGITNSMDMNWANSEIVKDREVCCPAVHGVTESDVTELFFQGACVF